ncbi:ABC transporter permease [Arthrobacter sp. zg-ZUI100]|uniref:ABC transporter permease n=1 Tax=Arthrobacter jiangjiafuii TaxID=2817475 RepID=UPI001AEDD666|nr:ABC transporter permease [Arthrobacter jiangjiafuii]MBP3036541.1 ABC transporter permease [Arthrobacter jiangjiafuii]
MKPAEKLTVAESQAQAAAVGNARTGASPGGPIRENINRTWWDKHRHSSIVWALRAAVLIAFLVLWELASGTVVDATFISKPTEIWARLVEWIKDGTLADNTWITLQEIIIGFFFGALAGAVVGYIMASINILFEVLDPFMLALYSIPKVALAPLFIVWFGIGIEMKILLAAISVFFLVFLNTAAGVRDVDRGLIDAVRLMGGNKWDIVRKVVLPASMTGLLTGLKVAIPYALIGAVIGELVASNQGLGYLINSAAAQFDTAGVFATIVVLTIVATILNFGVTLLGRRVNRWKPLNEH